MTRRRLVTLASALLVLLPARVVAQDASGEALADPHEGASPVSIQAAPRDAQGSEGEAGPQPTREALSSEVLSPNTDRRDTVRYPNGGLLDAWIRRRGATEEFLSTVTGVSSLSVGAVGVGLGVWLAADESLMLGGGLRILLPAASMVLGGLLMSHGIVQLSVGSGATDRWRRWREADAAGELTGLELARFEGELRGEASSARMTRMYTVALGTGVTVGSLLTMAVVAAVPGLTDREMVAGYTLGASYGLLGIATLVTGLIETSSEAVWDAYQRDAAPPVVRLETVRMRLLVGAGVVGVRGRF